MGAVPLMTKRSRATPKVGVPVTLAVNAVKKTNIDDGTSKPPRDAELPRQSNRYQPLQNMRKTATPHTLDATNIRLPHPLGPKRIKSAQYFCVS